MQIQEDLDKFALWEEKLMMKFHPDKCQVLSVTKNRIPIIKDSGARNICKILRDGGNYITSDLKWEKAYKKHLCQGK